MSNRVVFNATMTASSLIERMQRKETVGCPRCGADLVAGLDHATAAKLRVHLGIYCPQDQKHVQVLVEPRPAPGFWEQFERETAE